MEEELEWINNVYQEMCDVLAIKHRVPIKTCTDGWFGMVRSRQINRWHVKGKRKFPKYGKFIPYIIELDEEFLKACYLNCKDEILSPVFRTLIHEMCHAETTFKHTSRFYKLYYKFCMKWMAYCLGRKYNDCLKDKDIIKYINRYKLS